MAKPPIRLRLAKAILGSKAKEYIPSLYSIYDGWGYGSTPAGLNDYLTKSDQLTANVGWCFTANNAIAEPTAAVKMKLYKKLKNGKREEILEHEILDLLNNPNLAHTGEQMRHLHFTYMNFVGESYTYMRGLDGNPFTPGKGKLPAALEIFPAHMVQFTLDERYMASKVSYAGNEYPLESIIRDLNPDPARPYYGRSIIRAAALTIDLETQMKQWNRGVFANNARPSLIFSTKETLDDTAYERWKQQFVDQHTGTDNAYKPLLIENGDAKPFMLTQQDLDFLASRKFSMTEILSMWRVSPGLLGQLESANRSNLEAAFLINAIINVKPRIRQYVNQLNATLVHVYDPTLELDFEDPVPEDVDAKLKAAKEGVDKWWTKDEVREQYGDKPLDDKLGGQIYMANTNAPLSRIAESPKAPEPPAKPEKPEESDDAKKALRVKQVSANDFPGLYDGIDIDLDNLGCIMLNTETIDVTRFVDDGKHDLIESTDRHDHKMGAVAESEAHVTLLFGLLENGNVWKDKVDTVLDGWKADSVTVKDVTAFDLGDMFAIVGLIKKTPELIDGHERLTLLPHIQTFSEYKPHLTFAYFEHDQDVADKWVKALRAEYKGEELKTKGINYGDKPDEATKALYSLAGVKKKDLTPEEAEAARIQRGEAKKAKYDHWAIMFETQMVAAMAEQFNHQRDLVLAHLDTSRIGKAYGTKVKGKQPVYTRKDWLDDLIDWAAASESFAEAIKPIVHATLLQAGRDAMQDLIWDASTFDPFTPAILEYFQSRSTKIAEDVTDETEKQLRASLSEGVVAGESSFQLRARVEAVMGTASTRRADNIARYEVSHAQSFGDIQAWTQSGVVEGKEWYTAHDEHVCPGCSSMDGTIIGLAENFFDQGDELVVDRPGKDSPYRLKLDYEAIAGCPLHNRCRCTMLPVRKSR